MPFHWHFGISSDITTARALWSCRSGPPATVAVQSIHSYSCSKWDQPAYALGSPQACSCSWCTSTCSTLSKEFVLHEYTRTKRVPNEVRWLLPSAQCSSSDQFSTHSAASYNCQCLSFLSIWELDIGESVPLLIYCYIFSKKILLCAHCTVPFSCLTY